MVFHIWGVSDHGAEERLKLPRTQGKEILKEELFLMRTLLENRREPSARRWVTVCSKHLPRGARSV
jgi:hypothetical protein